MFIEFFAGTIAMGYLMVAFFFLRFWRSGHDRLFLLLAIAFLLFALNQVVAAQFDVSDERLGYTYIIRVLGYLVILYAILRKRRRLPFEQGKSREHSLNGVS